MRGNVRKVPQVCHRLPVGDSLYRFDAAKYRKLTRKGFNFEL